MMKALAKRRREEEQSQNGLVITRAIYGEKATLGATQPKEAELTTVLYGKELNHRKHRSMSQFLFSFW